MSSDDNVTNLSERIRKMNLELQNKLMGESGELLKQTDSYIKQMKESSRLYWENLLKQEVDSMERDLRSGNILVAMNHKVAIEYYQMMLRLTQT